MSKASRWSRQGKDFRFRERLSKWQKKRKYEAFFASVNQRGGLDLPDRYVLTPKEALRLARFIFAAFGVAQE